MALIDLLPATETASHVLEAQPALFTVRETLEAQTPEGLGDLIGSLHDKRDELSDLIRQAEDVYAGITGEQYNG